MSTEDAKILAENLWPDGYYILHFTTSGDNYSDIVLSTREGADATFDNLCEFEAVSTVEMMLVNRDFAGVVREYSSGGVE